MADESVKFEDGEYGRRAVVTSFWTSDTAGLLLANNVYELELNHAKGWRGRDLSFLINLPQLRVFKIIDWEIPSIEPVHFLHELRVLEMMTYCRTAIRFSEFPHLEDCTLEWRPKSESLFSCTTLRRLFVNRYRKKNVDAFSRLVNLEFLAVLNAPVENLQGLSSLKRLKHLRLGNLRRLTSLGGIGNLGAVEELNINTCRRISSIGEIGSLSHLRKLHLDNCGEIDSLKPLDKLTRLEWVTFVESSNVQDGDISPLVSQTNLSRISFKNRRHYSHRREDFGAAYFGSELMKQIDSGAKRPSIKEMVKSTESPIHLRKNV